MTKKKAVRLTVLRNGNPVLVHVNHPEVPTYIGEVWIMGNELVFLMGGLGAKRYTMKPGRDVLALRLRYEAAAASPAAEDPEAPGQDPPS